LQDFERCAPGSSPARTPFCYENLGANPPASFANAEWETLNGETVAALIGKAMGI